MHASLSIILEVQFNLTSNVPHLPFDVIPNHIYPPSSDGDILRIINDFSAYAQSGNAHSFFSQVYNQLAQAHYAQQLNILDFSLLPHALVLPQPRWRPGCSTKRRLHGHPLRGAAGRSAGFLPVAPMETRRSCQPTLLCQSEWSHPATPRCHVRPLGAHSISY